MSAAPNASSTAKQPRLRRQRSVTESLLSIVLGLEIVLVFFAALVLFGLRRLEPMQALLGALALIVVLALVSRMLRAPWGAWVGLAVQTVFIAAGLLEPIMFLIGAGFAAMYLYFFVKGRQIDLRNARFATMSESNTQGEQ